MPDAFAARAFTKGERATSAPHLSQTGASWIKVEADRDAWPDTGGGVIEVVTEVDEGRGWAEVGRFTANGGVKLGRGGVESAVSSITFRRDRPWGAGTLIRARVEASEALATAVRINWG